MRIKADGKVFRSPEEWVELIEPLESSGRNSAEFCQNEGLVETTLYKWRMKLRKAAESRGRNSC